MFIWDYIKERLKLYFDEKALDRELKLFNKRNDVEELKHRNEQEMLKIVKKKEDYDKGIIDHGMSNDDPFTSTIKGINDILHKRTENITNRIEEFKKEIKNIQNPVKDKDEYQFELHRDFESSISPSFDMSYDIDVSGVHPEAPEVIIQIPIKFNGKPTLKFTSNKLNGSNVSIEIYHNGILATIPYRARVHDGLWTVEINESFFEGDVLKVIIKGGEQAECNKTSQDMKYICGGYGNHIIAPLPVLRKKLEADPMNTVQRYIPELRCNLIIKSPKVYSETFITLKGNNIIYNHDTSTVITTVHFIWNHFTDVFNSGDDVITFQVKDTILKVSRLKDPIHVGGVNLGEITFMVVSNVPLL